MSESKKEELVLAPNWIGKLLRILYFVSAFPFALVIADLTIPQNDPRWYHGAYDNPQFLHSIVVGMNLGFLPEWFWLCVLPTIMGIRIAMHLNVRRWEKKQEKWDAKREVQKYLNGEEK